MPKSIKLYETEMLTLLSLPDEQRNHIITAILCDCLGQDVPELDVMEKAVYTLVKEQIKRAEELSNKRRQNINSRWGDTKPESDDTKDIQNHTNDIQNDTKPESDDTKAYTYTNTITNTNTNTITNNTPPTPSKGAGGAKKQTEKPKPEKVQFAEFVSMTNDEYTSLVTKVGEQGAKRCIEILDNYKGSSGKKYLSDYRAMLNWVVARYREEQAKQSNNSDTKEENAHSYNLDLLVQHAIEHTPQIKQGGG